MVTVLAYVFGYFFFMGVAFAVGHLIEDGTKTDIFSNKTGPLFGIFWPITLPICLGLLLLALGFFITCELFE